MYRWKGTVQSEQEIVVLLKTTEQKWTELLEEIDRVHPYDVPEVLALPIEAGSKDYLAWVKSETLPGPQETD